MDQGSVECLCVGVLVGRSHANDKEGVFWIDFLVSSKGIVLRYLATTVDFFLVSGKKRVQCLQISDSPEATIESWSGGALQQTHQRTLVDVDSQLVPLGGICLQRIFQCEKLK